RTAAQRAGKDREAGAHGSSAAGSERSAWPSTAGWWGAPCRRSAADSRRASPLGWISPLLLLLPVDAIFHDDARLVRRSVSLLVRLDDVHNMRDGPVADALLRPPVTATNLRRCQRTAADRDIQPVCALNIVRSPAEVSRGHESRIGDHRDLEQQHSAANG